MDKNIAQIQVVVFIASDGVLRIFSTKKVVTPSGVRGGTFYWQGEKMYLPKELGGVNGS